MDSKRISIPQWGENNKEWREWKELKEFFGKLVEIFKEDLHVDTNSPQTKKKKPDSYFLGKYHEIEKVFRTTYHNLSTEEKNRIDSQKIKENNNDRFLSLNKPRESKEDIFPKLNMIEEKKEEEKDFKINKKRKFVVQELYNTEKTYIKTLETIIQNYKYPLENMEIISQETIGNIFSNIESIHQLQCKFLQHLEEMINDYNEDLLISKAFENLKENTSNVYR